MAVCSPAIRVAVSGSPACARSGFPVCCIGRQTTSFSGASHNSLSAGSVVAVFSQLSVAGISKSLGSCLAPLLDGIDMFHDGSQTRMEDSIVAPRKNCACSPGSLLLITIARGSYYSLAERATNSPLQRSSLSASQSGSIVVSLSVMSWQDWAIFDGVYVRMKVIVPPSSVSSASSSSVSYQSIAASSDIDLW